MQVHPAGSLAPAGSLTADAGAAAALRRGKSLLAAGVKGVEGFSLVGGFVLIGLEISEDRAFGYGFGVSAV